MPVAVPSDFVYLTGVDATSLVDDRRRSMVNNFFLTEMPLAQREDFFTCRYGPPEPCLKLNDIVVRRDWRGKGIGSQLLDAVVRYADIKQLPVWMCVVGNGKGDAPWGRDLEQAMNTVRLITWYRRFGFGFASEDDRRRFRINCSAHEEMTRHPS